MAEGDENVGALSREIVPKVSNRDSRGDAILNEKPVPMFEERAIEGDPVTGDTRDGGDDARLRRRERELADGDEGGTRGRSAEDAQDLRRTPEDTENDELVDDEQIDVELQPVDDEGAEKYEVLIDGKPHEVTLAEALRGYVRTSTFHQRVAQLTEIKNNLDTYDAQLRANWAWWDKARADYEEDLAHLIPAEPNWDQEFATNPSNAHGLQKIFQTLYAKLAESRQARAQREQAAAAETDRRIQKYAVDGFSKFVMDHIKSMPDEPSLKKNVQSMRRTAVAAGFSEYEVATVYDPRMLDILWKASKYDRMMMARPKAVIPGKGKTLTPGAATPIGNARRKGFDDAQRQLASSGRLDDAAEVFRRML